MKTYLVCDQDSLVFQESDAWDAHFISNPTHTSHIGVGGDSSSPTAYSTGGSSTVSQVIIDPTSPTTGQYWLRATGTVGIAGQAMGVLGLTYSQTEVEKYELSIKTAEGYIKRVRLL